MSTDPRGFAVVLFVGLVVICASLLHNRVLGGGWFAASVAASAIAVVLLVNSDRLEQLLVKQGTNTLEVQLRKIQQDVYVKVEQLQRIAEGMASMVAVGVASENRLAGEDHVERMLRRRDELVAFLSADDVASKSAAVIVRPIDLMADWDLRRRISIEAQANWRLRAGEDANEPQQRVKDVAMINEALGKPDRLAAVAEVERLLRGELRDRIEYATVEPALARYRSLLQAGRLPALGPADDLSQSPLK